MTGVKFHFSEEQIAWLKENFADTPNDDLCAFLQCGGTTLRMLKNRYGLAKSAAYLAERDEKARKGREIYYRTHKPKDNSAHLRPYCFKKGNDPRTLKGFWDGVERAKATRRESIREEKARIAFGLPQRTGLILKKQPRAKVHQRHYLKKCGYILDEANHVAYWTSATKRAFKIEERERNYYRFKEQEAV